MGTGLSPPIPANTLQANFADPSAVVHPQYVNQLYVPQIKVRRVAARKCDVPKPYFPHLSKKYVISLSLLISGKNRIATYILQDEHEVDQKGLTDAVSVR
jgi:hypothetical protein